MKIAVFFVGRKRPGFDPQWGAFLEREIQAQLRKSSFEPIFFSAVSDETLMKEAVAASREAGADVVIVNQPTMGDGNLWPVLVSAWDGPIIVWATPEHPEKNKVTACGLVGAHNWVSGMSQVGRPPWLVYGMPNQEATIADLNQAINTAATSSKIRRARVGLIGDHAPGFLNMAVDASAMQRLLGPTLRRFGLHEFIDLVRTMPGSDVAADRKKAEALSVRTRSDVTLTDDDWNLSSRYYLALKTMVNDESLDAIALRCWPELPNVLGAWPYFALARLASDGVNICEEGDVDGAIACLLAKSLGCETPAFNSDWLAHDDQSITLWHSGATPWEMCEPIGSPKEPELAIHYNNRKPLVVDSQILAGIPVTMFRLWRMGDRYSLAICEGWTEPSERRLEGCSGRVRIPGGGVKQFFIDACTAGMPHHVAVMKGHYASHLKQLAVRHLPVPITIPLCIELEK